MAGQIRSFDQVSFTPPSGWSSSQISDHITFTTIDNTARTFAMLGVYTSTATSGNSQRDFASEWMGIVAKSFHAGPAPASTPGHTRQGLEFREGSGTVTQKMDSPLMCA